MRKREKRLKLYTALKIGYLRDENKQAKALSKFGYMLDRRISDGRQSLVAYNPTKNEVLFVSNGTDPMNQKDLLTDLVLATGAIKQTARYKETKDAYDMAKDKYKNAKFVDVGHSLGGGLLYGIGRPNDDTVITYNAAFTPNQKVREGIVNYRTQGDVFSTFAPAQTTTQLVNTNTISEGVKNYLLKTHTLENIKKEPIYV
jgi:uncharacterized surface protein with fasciclin (FAS1) repeats